VSLVGLLAKHLEMVVWIVTVKGAEKKKSKDCRGYEVQEERREMERSVRIRAVDLAVKLKEAGYPRAWVAPKLGMSVRALAEWQRRWEEDRLEAKARGRPIEQLDRVTREEIEGVLHILGPFEGVPVLQSLFPDVARAELEHRLHRYRERFVSENHVDVMALKWLRPGAVWAMDFNHPPNPVDLIYERIFAVRDLGSGSPLMWLPTSGESSIEVCRALESLFLQYGAPMVIKEDNGSAFRSEDVRNLLEKWNVIFLMSPPHYPEYNGSVESGIGTLKTYAHHEAARNDRPGEWTCDDVEAARLRANELSRPRGLRGPTPSELWETRTPISSGERNSFYQLAGQSYEEALEERKEEKEGELGNRDRAAAMRQAIACTLVARGLLSIRRRRISPPIKSKFWARIK
jgi:transposase InsO family protein